MESDPHPASGSRPVHATASDPRWNAVATRDRSADGTFFYGVTTTGIFCRPGCASRRARIENVVFFGSADEARQSGFRACKRCRPDATPNDVRTGAVARLCRWIDDHEGTPTLSQMAGHAGLSPFHLHRMFKAVTGMTPHAYTRLRTERRLRESLAGASSVTDAIYQAGYGSSGRFYERADAVVGMSPAQYRRGGEGAVVRFAVGECSLGSIVVAASERGVCAIFLGDDPQMLVEDLQDRFPRAQLVGGDASFEHWVAVVVGMVEAPSRSAALPLDLQGTLFQQRVWQALRDIAPGSTVSYTQLAQRIGAPGAVRAVARACAANPVAIAIPCHRVVRQDGSLSGYRWGVERKRQLLQREAASRAAQPGALEPATLSGDAAKQAGR